jgi:serine/threonine-protein phosphatase 2A regulatory subunit B
MVDKHEEKKEELKIMEWRYNQFLGEKLTYEQIKSDPENEGFLVTNCKFSSDGANIVVTDKGGRVILFKRGESKTNKQPKLDYYYEFAAQEKEFDVHKSIEYAEEIKGLAILTPAAHNKIDLLTANSRTIKLDRIFKDKARTYENMLNGRSLCVPKIASVKNEVKHKTRKVFKHVHHNDINSIADNRINNWNFLSADDFKVFLWDLNSNTDVYNVVDIDSTMDLDNPEKITKSVFCEYNPSIFAYGTNKGNIRFCDLRTSSDQMCFSTTFNDENSNLNKTVFANALLSVHDINMGMSNSYTFATRHYLSINLWDIRKQTEPTTKFLTYEPIINKLSYLYQNNYLEDKFSLSVDREGKYLLTGGYNNMFHVIDIEQRLNTQICIDESSEKIMNTNVIRKINSKGSCFYKKDDASLNNINFDRKILHQAYSPIDNYSLLIVYNCIYSYVGSITKKEAAAKK